MHTLDKFVKRLFIERIYYEFEFNKPYYLAVFVLLIFHQIN